ncbi:MAG: hypothetical protein NXI29_11235 [bacterium]|nr:hypothetical protein [bacterium]
MILLYPQFAVRDCIHCLKYAYNDTPGTEGFGKVETHNGRADGRPNLRHQKHLPLCKTPSGCPKGTPEKQNTLTHRNIQAYLHYLECKAVGSFPDDPIVRRNARLIQRTVDQASEKKRFEELVALMGANRSQ